MDNEKRWYVLHIYSGYEKRVKNNLEKRIETTGMQEKIFQVLIPEEEEVSIKDGEKKIAMKKVYPGYVLVEMIMSDDSWYIVRNTPGVTGFVGAGNKPVPLEDYEVAKIKEHMGIQKKAFDFHGEIGDKVEVIEGAFSNFIGEVTGINPEKGTINVSVSMFGRETPLELDFNQIKEID